MIALKKDAKGETLVGVIKDNQGNEVEICAYYGRFELIMASTSIGIPIFSLMIRVTDGLSIQYEDNYFRGIGLSKIICEYADRGEFNKEVEIKGQMVKVEHHTCSMFCGISGNLLIVCIGVKDDGEIINYWCDADYRKSESLDTYIDVAHGVGIKKGWFATGIKSFYAFVAVDNKPSIKYVTKVGCQLCGQSVLNGAKFNIYRYTAQSRIDRAKEAVLKNNIEVELQ